MSRPFLAQKSHFSGLPQSERLEQYYRSGRMLIKLAEAIGRISLAGRELTRLAGYTERVVQLSTVLDDLNKGVYQRTMVGGGDEDKNKSKDNKNSVQLKANAGKIIYKDKIIK